MSGWEAQIAALTQNAMGCAATEVRPIEAGLGAQRFFRVLCRDGRSAIARVKTENARGSGPEPPLEGIRSFLESAGLPVPRCHGRVNNIDLLEDLGEQHLAEFAAASPEGHTRSLYEAACMLIPRLQRLAPPPNPPAAFVRRYLDFLPIKRARTQAVSLPDWLGRPPRPAERECVDAAFDTVEEVMRNAPARLAHRDFQSSNLLVREGRVFMIDLQGAFTAPPEYDLMCLLRDSYVVLPDRWVQELSESTRAALPDAPDPEVFQRRFDLLCIARKAKDDAFFLEAERRGDPRYARFRDANRRYLGDAARRLANQHPCFEAWASWFEASPPAREIAACAP